MTQKGYVPIRMCMGCGKRRKKEEMIRFTRTAGDQALVPAGKNQDGRGFYLCPDASCLKAANKKRRLKSFKGNCKLKNEQTNLIF